MMYNVMYCSSDKFQHKSTSLQTIDPCKGAKDARPGLASFAPTFESIGITRVIR